MKQKLSLGERFFAPTPLKTMNVILSLLAIAIVAGISYLFTFDNLTKYVAFLLIAISAILQFQVDFVAYALDKFEPNGGILVEKKSDNFDFFENLDLNTATIQQLYDAHFHWWALTKDNPVGSDYYLHAISKLEEINKALKIAPRKAKMPDNIEHEYAMDEASKLVLYQPKRDPKTGKFIKKDA